MQNIVAQNIHSENHVNGALKFRYHVRANDTFCTEQWHENGLHQATFWQDSAHFFHSNRAFAKKSYGKNRNLPDWLWIASNKNETESFDLLQEAATAYTFYPDGKQHESVIWEGDSLVTQKTYLPNGKLYQTIQYQQFNHQIFNYFEIKGNEKLHFKTDTFAKIQERLGYRNGELVHHEIFRWDADLYPHPFELQQLVLKEGGKIDFNWQADTAKWKLFRSESTNLYGFQNGAGDWVVLPKYDFATRFNKAYFIVNEHGKYGVLNEYGNIIIPIEWDFLESFDINHRPSFDLLPVQKETALPIFPYAAMKPDRNAQLCFRKGSLYGVIDWRGEIILPPVYEEIRQCYNDLYEVKIKEHWGIVDRMGKIIVSPQYKAVAFTQFKDLFITTDTITYPADALHAEERLRFGLVNAENKVLLPPTFAILQVESGCERCFHTYSFQKEAILGVYHADKGWLLDTVAQCRVEPRLQQQGLPTQYQLLFQMDSSLAKRYGLLDVMTGNLLLPFDFQNITYFTKNNYYPTLAHQSPEKAYRKDIFLHCVKQGKHGIFDPQQRKWLIPLQYDEITRLGDGRYVTSKRGKRQVRNEQGKKV
jgi:hypothetical protein